MGNVTSGQGHNCKLPLDANRRERDPDQMISLTHARGDGLGEARRFENEIIIYKTPLNKFIDKVFSKKYFMMPEYNNNSLYLSQSDNYKNYSGTDNSYPHRDILLKRAYCTGKSRIPISLPYVNTEGDGSDSGGLNCSVPVRGEPRNTILGGSHYNNCLGEHHSAYDDPGRSIKSYTIYIDVIDKNGEYLPQWQENAAMYEGTNGGTFETSTGQLVWGTSGFQDNLSILRDTIRTKQNYQDRIDQIEARKASFVIAERASIDTGQMYQLRLYKWMKSRKDFEDNPGISRGNFLASYGADEERPKDVWSSESKCNAFYIDQSEIGDGVLFQTRGTSLNPGNSRYGLKRNAESYNGFCGDVLLKYRLGEPGTPGYPVANSNIIDKDQDNHPNLENRRKNQFKINEFRECNCVNSILAIHNSNNIAAGGSAEQHNMYMSQNHDLRCYNDLKGKYNYINETAEVSQLCVNQVIIGQAAIDNEGELNLIQSAC
jgi:hypothetical protein